MHRSLTAPQQARALVARLQVVLAECQRLLVAPAPADDQLAALRLRKEEAAYLLTELEALLPPDARDGGRPQAA